LHSVVAHQNTPVLSMLVSKNDTTKQLDCQLTTCKKRCRSADTPNSTLTARANSRTLVRKHDSAQLKFSDGEPKGSSNMLLPLNHK
jgi:hypothetical protein